MTSFLSPKFDGIFLSKQKEEYLNHVLKNKESDYLNTLSLFRRIGEYEAKTQTDIIEMDKENLIKCLREVRCRNGAIASRTMSQFMWYFWYHGATDKVRCLFEKSQDEVFIVESTPIIDYRTFLKMLSSMEERNPNMPHYCAIMACTFIGIDPYKEALYITTNMLDMDKGKISLPSGRVVDVSNKKWAKRALQKQIDSKGTYGEYSWQYEFLGTSKNSLFKIAIKKNKGAIWDNTTRHFLSKVNAAMKELLMSENGYYITLKLLYDSGLLHFLQEFSNQYNENLQDIVDYSTREYNQLLRLGLAEFGSSLSTAQFRRKFGKVIYELSDSKKLLVTRTQEKQ